eukprot:2043535-Amphidinium_carterae.1
MSGEVSFRIVDRQHHRQQIRRMPAMEYMFLPLLSLVFLLFAIKYTQVTEHSNKSHRGKLVLDEFALDGATALRLYYAIPL